MRWLHAIPLLLLSSFNSCQKDVDLFNKDMYKSAAVDITLHEYWAYDFLRNRGLGHACTHPQHGPCENTENMGVHFYIEGLSTHSYSGRLCCVSQGNCVAEVNVHYYSEEENRYISDHNDLWCESRHKRFERILRKPNTRNLTINIR